MKIRLYENFSKRDNSTKQPDLTGGTEFECKLKTPTSVTNPVIEITMQAYKRYSYAYIPLYDRCYYITDMVANSAYVWEISLACDVLASYRAEIGNYTGYVLRSAAAYDGRVIDNYYPVMTYRTTDSELIHLFGDPVENINLGCFVVGVVGYNNDEKNFGSIRYYCITASEMYKLVNGLLGMINDDDGGFDFTQISEPLTRAIVDPVQFIKSCVWLPVPYLIIADSPIPADSKLKIWDWEITCPNRPIKTNPAIYRVSHTFTLKKHPWTNTRGIYLNTEPYTKILLSIPPFGNFEMDTSLMAAADSATLIVDMDLMTGAGVATMTVSGVEVLRVSSQIGVPVQLSQARTDILGGVGGFANAAGNFVGALLSGNFGGAVASLTGAIGSSVQAVKPIVSSVGGSGSLSDLRGLAGLEYVFYYPVDEDNENNGRPLCEKRQVKTLPGFLLLSDGDVSINGMQGEQESIKNYLTNGFYYE